jgi:hypothetical protein
VVERLEGMPPGTLGFRLSGRISRDEYFQILDPVRVFEPAQLEEAKASLGRLKESRRARRIDGR